MQDALELAEAIIARKAELETPGTDVSAKLSEASKVYESTMFVRALENGKQTWMYLDLFFHERGGVAMVEHFERVRAKERADAEAAAAAAAVVETKA